ncbi:MAG TPA: thioredoxin family protein [Planctomycetota bacterium]|nr:thioredoxin family protein [Planctomycetota bacterium]
MRSKLLWCLIGCLFIAVACVAYTASGAADPLPGRLPPEDPNHPRPHFVSTWQADFNLATDAARRQNRPILARFTGSDWCIYCIRFHAEIEDTPEFQKWAADHVVLFDADFPQTKPQTQSLKDQNQALSDKYGVDAFPTLLVLYPDGKELARLGYVQGGVTAWLPDAQAALDKAQPTGQQPVAKP